MRNVKLNFLLLFASIFFLLTSSFPIAFGQTAIPQVVSFSAVVRDANNQPLVNTPVSIRLTFRKGGQSGALVYCALHQDVSNANGFISLQLNRGVLGTGCNGAPSTAFEDIPWHEGGFWMEVEYQAVPNTPFTSLGQLELASSFYAFASGTAEKVNGVNLEGAQNGYVLAYNQTTGKWEPTPATAGPQGPEGPAGPQGPAGQNGAAGPAGQGYANGTAPGQMMYWNGTAWVGVSPGSHGQTLSFCNGVPTWGPCSVILPTLTTTAISAITSNAAASGGSITNDGAAPITARGVCWSTAQNPTVALSTKTNDGSGPGTFSSSLSGLSPNTTYYIRAYATNSAGTAYGNEVSFTTAVSNNPTDVDGNTYNTVTIGNQTWMRENLTVTRYRNGDPIPTLPNDGNWQSATSGAYAIYNNNQANNIAFGKLYNHYAVVDPRGLCPVGWHVPSDEEWTIMEEFLGGINVAGGKLKAVSLLWNAPNTGANNTSGFSGLPGGRRRIDGAYEYVGEYGYWWTISGVTPTSFWSRSLLYFNAAVGRYSYMQPFGLSVRCLKD